MKLKEKRARKKRKEQKSQKRNRQKKAFYFKARLNQKPLHITYSKGKTKKRRGKLDKIAVILLGAGAAKTWSGPLTSEIDTIIKEDTTFRTVTDRIPIGEFVFNKLEEFYSMHGCINFETFLGVLEFLIDFVFSKTNEGGTSPANTSFTPLISNLDTWVNELKDFRIEEVNGPANEIQLFIPRENENFSTEDRSNIERIYFSGLLKHYYRLVATRIEEYTLSLTDSDNLAVNNSLINFIQYLKQSGYTIRAYTTNYDRLFPKILRKQFRVFDGFNTKDSSEYNSADDYKINQILNEKSDITYYNLHGCLNWERSFNGSRLGYRFACTPNKTHTTIEFKSMVTANPGHTLLPINIVTGYNKVQRLSLEPLIYFYNSFVNDCNSADFIITIGYSFGDFHINRALSLGIQKSHTQHLHIGFSDSSQEYISSSEFSEIHSIHRLSEGYLRIVPNEQKWLKSDDAKQRRKVYLNGFEQFLLNKNW